MGAATLGLSGISLLNKLSIPFANAFSDRCIIREIKLVVVYTLDRRTDGTAVLHVFFDAASIQGRLLLNFKAFGCGLYSRAASI